jgi:uncharacterized protein (DUF2344 family)
MALTKITSSVVEDGGIDHSNLPDTGVVSGSYGTGSAVPVLTVNEKGFVTAISTTAVAGVDDFTWNSVNETLTIDTSDGSSYSVDMSGLASETYVNTSIANLVDTAPATLDTLNELAAALGDDPNFATTMTNALAGKVDDSQVLTNVPSGAVFTDTVYTHPSYNGDDFSVDTGALAGATVVSDIDINVTTDTLGHVTDANGVVATRTLTLADLGYTGATNANNYVHPSYAGDDINLDTGPLSGATVISDLDFNVTTDTQGHVTDANATYSTRNLTYSDVGAAPASHSHSYLPLSGGTITGRLVLPDSGYSIGNEYHTWKRSYKINNTSPANLVYHDGTELDAGGAYRFHAHIAGTGTDQSATAVFWNQNGTWKVNVTYQSGTSSNHPEFIIGGSPEAPQIHIDHTSNYTVEVLGERLELSEGAGTDNLAGFGTDAFLGSVGGVLRYNNAGSANNYSQGNQVFHDGYHPNADKWTTARTLSLTGDVTGSVSWDGSGNASITATVADDSHNHTIANVDGLQTALDSKLNSTSYTAADVLTKIKTVDGAGSGLDADLLDGYDSSRFMRRTGKGNAIVGGGWMTVATCGGGRFHGEIIVTDADSSDHAFIRIDWMRSYIDSNFTVLNCGGHTNRIQGARVLYNTSDNTYGTKYLQVYVTANSNYEVNVYELGDIADYGVPSVVTPVIQNSISGYAVHGNEITGLDTYGHAAEEGIIAGGPIRSNNSMNVSGNTVWHAGNDGAGSGLDADLLDGKQGSYYQPASTAITTSNIGSQNVASADTANGLGDNITTSAGNFKIFTNDGGGNIGLRWNASGSGASLVENGQAYELEIANDSNNGDFVIKRGTTASGTAGDAITWNESLRIEGTTGAIHAAQGFVGDLTGVASTATKLATARTISLAGDVTGSTSWDGSGNASITATVANDSHNHTSLTGVTSISFAAQATDSMSISRTINATGTYFDFNLSDDNNNDWWRWRFNPTGSTVYDAMTLKPVSNGNSNLTVNGTIRATGDVISNSDIRLKSDIKPINNPIETVKALNGKTYIKDDKASIGLIAQEVEEVLPQLVHTASDEMGTKSVAYGNIVAVLIEAVKEQQKQIDELKEKLNGI